MDLAGGAETTTLSFRFGVCFLSLSHMSDVIREREPKRETIDLMSHGGGGGQAVIFGPTGLPVSG